MRRAVISSVCGSVRERAKCNKKRKINSNKSLFFSLKQFFCTNVHLELVFF